MRTSIFNNFVNLSKDFREDFDVLWKLPNQTRKSLISHVSKVTKTKTSGEKKKAIDQAVNDVGGNPAEVLRSLSLLRFIYKEWNPIHDTAASFVKDLAELSLIPTSNVEEAKAFLLDFLAEVEKDNTYRLEKIFASSGMPKYEQASTLVDFRAVIRNPYGSGLDDEIAKYDPTCIGFTPVILINILRDSGDPKSFDFQCQEDGLERLINTLQAALVDLKAAKRSLPGGI